MDNKSQNINKAALVGTFLLLLVGIATVSRFLSSHKSSDDLKKNDASQEKKKVNSISSEDLLKKISLRDPMVVVDVRDNEVFQASHILDSKNVSPDTVDNFFSSQDKNNTFIIVDDGNSGNQSELLADALAKEGFKNSFFLEGGFADWLVKFGPIVSAGDPESFSDQAKVTYISSDDLRKEIDNETQNLYIIDVRKNAGFADGHIKNAVNMYLETLEQNRRQIPLGKKIIVYDNDGLWAFMAAVRLSDMGIGNVRALSDGLDAWKEKGYEIEK